MTAKITLPGSWVRECSPVVDTTEPLFGLERTRGVVVALGDEWDPRVRVAWWIGPDNHCAAKVHAHTVDLDLTHKTGLQHAIAGLVERIVHGLADVQALATHHGSDSLGWSLHVQYAGRNAHGLVSGEFIRELDQRPESLAHAVQMACIEEAR